MRRISVHKLKLRLLLPCVPTTHRRSFADQRVGTPSAAARRALLIASVSRFRLKRGILQSIQRNPQQTQSELTNCLADQQQRQRTLSPLPPRISGLGSRRAARARDLTEARGAFGVRCQEEDATDSEDDSAFVVCPFSLRELRPYERRLVRYRGRLSQLIPVSCLSFSRRLLR